MTRKCIYCLSTDNPFKGGEHVISQYLGKFQPDLQLSDVCFVCNSVRISKLETLMKEDSIEGYLAAIYRLRKGNSVRFRNERLKIKLYFESGEQTLFTELLPTINAESGDCTFPSQAVFKGKNGKTQIMYPDCISKSKLFGKRIEWTGTKGLTIIINGTADEVEKMKRELRNRGLPCQDNQDYEMVQDSNTSSLRFDVIFNNPDEIFDRFIAKLAFNYFAFLMINTHLDEHLFDSRLDALKNFVIEGQGKIPVFLNSRSLQNGFDFGKAKNPRHTFKLYVDENDQICVDLKLFSWLEYTVFLSSYLFKTLPKNSFGASHIFDIASRKVINAGNLSAILDTKEMKVCK